MTPQEQTRQFLDDILRDTDCFVVDFKVKPTNNFKIYLDSDTGFTLEKSMQINRALRRKAEDSGLFPDGDFSLEVSSPGIDAPLKMHRQYLRNIGRKLEVVPVVEDAPGLSGRLLSVSEEGIRLEVTPIRRRGVKAPVEPEVMELPFSHIRSATVQIEF